MSQGLFLGVKGVTDRSAPVPLNPHGAHGAARDRPRPGVAVPRGSPDPGGGAVLAVTGPGQGRGRPIPGRAG